MPVDPNAITFNSNDSNFSSDIFESEVGRTTGQANKRMVNSRIFFENIWKNRMGC